MDRGKPAVTAMMDLSDGLAKDLPRLATSCGVGFQIEPRAIPRTRGCTVEQAVGDGEDYELLFAVSPKMRMDLLDHWRQAFPKLKLTLIGKLVDERLTQSIASGGWEHFR